MELTVSSDAHHLFVRDVSERERLRADVARLHSDLARATTHAAQLAADLALKDGELAAATREQERLRAELARSESGRGHAEQELANTAAARDRTQRALDQVSRERARLEADAAALRRELGGAERRTQLLSRELEQARAELARTRAALTDARRLAQEAHARAERTREELEETRGRFEQARAELERARVASEQTQADLARARGEWQRTRSELDEARGDSRRTRAELERAQAEGARTRGSLEEAVRRGEQTSQELQRAQDETERTGQELARVGAERARFGADRGILRLELERTQGARQDAELALEESHQALEASQRALDGSRSDVEASNAALQASQAALEESRAALDSKAAELAEALGHRELLEERGSEVIARYDGGGVCLYVSPACRRLLGYEPEELVGRQGAELIHPDDRRLLQAARAADAESRFEIRLRRKDGALAWVEAAVRPVRDSGSGRLVELHASLRDASDRRAARARLDALFREAPVATALMTPDGRLEDVNPAFRDLTGYSAGQLEGAGLVAVVHPEDGDAFVAALRRLRSREQRSDRSEQRLVHADGRVLPVDVNLAVVGGSGQVVAQLQDLSERAAAQLELLRVTDHDPLTGLFNRTRFEDDLRRELASAARYGTHGAVLVADLDFFMDVNGLLGRSAADELLARLGDALRRRLRSTDLVARAGGDQFAVWLPRAGEPEARQVANALLEAIRDVGASDLQGTPLRLTGSLGIAPQRDDACGAEELLVEAEIAVHDAKQAGGDRASVFDPSGGRPAAMRERLTWAERIRAAIDHDRLVLHAQPVVSLAGDHSHLRYELLPRMVGESGELVPAAVFLPAAERFGLAAEIDRWALERAIPLLADERRPLVELALSARALSDPGLPSFIAERLAKIGGDAGRLCLTIPEPAAIGSGDGAGLLTRRLADLGCEVGLDRFGAGLASFRHLEHLAVGYLKVDAGLVESLRTSEGSRLVLRSIAEVAGGLGRRTAARAVADQETLALVRVAGIGYAQGPALGPARPFEELGTRHLHVA